jgi:hypothetical protein
VILVDRSRVVAPIILTDKKLKGGGISETKRAKAFFRLVANRGKAFDYSIYRHVTVKAALEALFHCKCAYCEFNYSPGGPAEVEHWRPKGEVEDEGGTKIRPGYYWLAAEWENLFPSCIDCNRERYHRLGNGEGGPVLLGKANAFPLAAGSVRATRPKKEPGEVPLLLNPCRDDPSRHLHFAEEEEAWGIVRAVVPAAPATPNDALVEPRATASIRVYALNRSKLVQARKKRVIDIKAQMVRVDEARQRVQEASTPTIAARESAVHDRELNVLLSYTDDSRDFSLLGKHLVVRYLGERGLGPI